MHWRLLILSALAATAIARTTYDGEECVFPFEYDGNVYTDCTSEGSRLGREWCATTADYTNDQEYGFCTAKETTTPAPVAVSDTCVFPFIYLNETYYTCTDKDSWTGLWCATTDNYDRDEEYISCPVAKETTTPAPVAVSDTCVFPFIYLNETYYTCTDKDSWSGLWCATTDNYDRDEEYISCPVSAKPVVEDPVCVFPFIYDNVTYTACTEVDSVIGAWCATTDNYDRDGEFMSCPGPEEEPEVCVFPFIYKNKTYTECTEEDSWRPWCATTSNLDIDVKFIFCPTKDEPKEKVCVFPFTYHNVTYSECTDVDSIYGLWCSITHDFEGDRLWMYCPAVAAAASEATSPTTTTTTTTTTEAPTTTTEAPTTTTEAPTLTEDGKVCSLPFTYNGETYNECTSVGSYRAWCSLTPVYDGKYGYCA